MISVDKLPAWGELPKLFLDYFGTHEMRKAFAVFFNNLSDSLRSLCKSSSSRTIFLAATSSSDRVPPVSGGAM